MTRPNMLRTAKVKIRPPDRYGETMQAITALSPGDIHVYSTDEFARDEDVWSAARDASDAGLVTLLARRNKGQLERIAVRRRV